MKTNRKLLIAGALFMTLCLGVTLGHANLITNGGFESGNNPPTGTFVTLFAGQPTAYDITGWLVTSGSIDWINSYWTPAEGTKSIDLSGNTPGGLQTATTFATVTGSVYKVSFYLAGNFDPGGNDIKKSVRVTADGHFQDFEFYKPVNWSHTNMGWVQVSWQFTADDSTATLSFASLESNAYGPAIDGVSASVVPLPGALLLLGAGLIRLATYPRRKH